MESKYFMWYDSGRPSHPIYGPHYHVDTELIGRAYYHSLEDLLKMRISESLKKKLNSAKIGTRILVHYLHSNGDLMLKRINENQLDSLNKMIALNQEIDLLEEKIKKLENEKDKFLKIINVK